MSDVGSIGGIGEPTPSTGSGGGGERRSKKEEKPEPEKKVAAPVISSLPHLDKEGRLREISEHLAKLQGDLLAGDLSGEEREKIQREIQSEQIAMENLLSVSPEDFDPQASLDNLFSQFESRAVSPQPGALGRLLRGQDT